jgi:hemerythrin-like domain-containing protein
MRHPALTILRDEHEALAAMLRSIPLLLAQARRDGVPPDFTALRAMLFYIDEFPERHHHRLESELLFPRLAERAPQLRDTIQKLEQDHAQGEQRVRDLAHALAAYELLGGSRREAFEQAAQRYVDFYLAHMRVEEQSLLPMAEQVLEPDDWAALDDAFTQHRDPLAGGATPDDYQALFTRIVHLVPAPLGLGPAAAH